jgi:hypothetical protein
MPGFTPHCPRCDSTDTKQIARSDRYADGASPVTSSPVATTFSYKCQCGLAFTFEVKLEQAVAGLSLDVDTPKTR